MTFVQYFIRHVYHFSQRKLVGGGEPKHFYCIMKYMISHYYINSRTTSGRLWKMALPSHLNFFIWKSTPITLSHLQVKLPGNAGDCICIFYPLGRFLNGWEFMVFAVPPHRHLAEGSVRITCVAMCGVEVTKETVDVMMSCCWAAPSFCC